MEATLSIGVRHVFRSLDEMLLEGRSAAVGIAMKLHETFGKVGTIQTPWGEQMIEDLPEAAPMEQ
jgi:hypothetical protein